MRRRKLKEAEYLGVAVRHVSRTMQPTYDFFDAHTSARIAALGGALYSRNGRLLCSASSTTSARRRVDRGNFIVFEYNSHPTARYVTVLTYIRHLDRCVSDHFRLPIVGCHPLAGHYGRSSRTASRHMLYLEVVPPNYARDLQRMYV